MSLRGLARSLGISHVAIHYMLREERDMWVLETKTTISLYEWKFIAGGSK